MDYVDASAFVKLVLLEAESHALRTELWSSAGLVSSKLLSLESRRAAARYPAPASARVFTLLQSVSLVPIDDAVMDLAASLAPPSLRSLDSIHLATALSLGEDLARFYCYDARLAEAALACGLDVAAPA